MNGLLLYREYLNNVTSCIVNYDIQKIESKSLSGVLDVAKDIEDLAYLDKILLLAGSGGLFDKNKEFINKSVRLESKLKNYVDIGDLESVISLDSLYDIEDSILDCIGDLADISNEINYKNISISNLNFGDDEKEIGLNKFETYKDEISKVFGIIDNFKINYKEEKSSTNNDVQEVGKKENNKIAEKEKIEEDFNDENNLQSEDEINDEIEIDETVDEIESEIDINEESDEEIDIDFSEILPDIEENTEIEGINEDEIGDIDEWVSNQDEELIKKYRDRELEDDYFERDYFDDFGDNSFDNNSTENIDDVLSNLEITKKDTKDKIKNEEKSYKKKEKLVEHKSVNDVDDALAKMILALNDNITKIPKATSGLTDKMRIEGKKIYSNMVVDDEDDEEGI